MLQLLSLQREVLHKRPRVAIMNGSILNKLEDHERLKDTRLIPRLVWSFGRLSLGANLCRSAAAPNQIR
jgi:hypothetical protein